LWFQFIQLQSGEVNMSKVAIVFYIGYGHAAEVAKAVARGAKEVAEAEVQLIPVATDGRRS
jgi:multimeric flavodoxin WrbA